MLKIKDNINLKELSGKYQIVLDEPYSDASINIDTNSRLISIPVDYGVIDQELDILYDLIKADLVVKVDD